MWKYPISYTIPARQKQGCAFVCLRGSAVDGHKFAANAAAAGAAAIVAQEPVEASGAQVILVEDTRRALALMSAAFFGNPAEGGHLCHRRDRNQGKDHHRLYDPLYFRGRRPQDRGHRHHRGAYGGGT